MDHLPVDLHAHTVPWPTRRRRQLRDSIAELDESLATQCCASTGARADSGENRRRPFPRNPLIFTPLGVLGIAGAAQLAIPMEPVPLTMQTYAVGMVGALGGARLGFATCAVYLVAAAAGAPILADAESGRLALVGATGGYLIAFPLAAAFVGAVEKRNRDRSAARSFGAMLGGHAIALAIGTTWLGRQIGTSEAVSGGLMPAIPGAFIKSALALGTLLAIRAVGGDRRV